MKQSQAVFEVSVSVLHENNVEFTPNETQLLPILKNRPELKKTIQEVLFAGFKSNKIDLKAQYDDKKLWSYCAEIINNFGRKDKRLNGGTEYEIQNPGSRAHVGDEVLKNMQLLLAQTKDESIKATIQAEIDKYIACKPTKQPKQVDFSKLPESLRKLIG